LQRSSSRFPIPTARADFPLPPINHVSFLSRRACSP
jgi:hypothetical protein